MRNSEKPKHLAGDVLVKDCGDNGVAIFRAKNVMHLTTETRYWTDFVLWLEGGRNLMDCGPGYISDARGIIHKANEEETKLLNEATEKYGRD